jgi:SNF2 family DNA or RNA helicase
LENSDCSAGQKIPSEFALVLTGTPLENKLEELHSLVEFVDPYKLGALFRFISNHQLVDESGKVIGYHKLNEIAESLSSIIIRRKKADVLTQLPERVDKNYFVNATKEQMEIHSEYYETVAKLVHKWRRHKYLSEADRKRLLLSLSCMRMVCDSTYILDQKTRHDTKIDELMVLLNDIFSNDGEKVVIFSQWERMTRLVAKELDKIKIKYEYLHGGIPSKKRKDLLHNFANDEKSRVFLSTDAGGVGLNLQSAKYRY